MRKVHRNEMGFWLTKVDYFLRVWPLTRLKLDRCCKDSCGRFNFEKTTGSISASSFERAPWKTEFCYQLFTFEEHSIKSATMW